MARLPRYQRIGLTARQPVSLDFAAAREEAQLGQTISQQLDRMSEFAFRRAAEEAERRGEERVREEGALPTLEAIRERGGPRGIAERAAVEAANRIAVVEIETLAKQDMQNLIREADKNNMPLSAFEASMADIQDGYAASLEEIDPVASGVLSARLSDSAMTYTGRYSDISFRKAQAAAKERTNQIMTIGSEEIVQLATQPGSTKESLEVAAQKFKADMLELGVQEKNAQKVIDATLKTAIRQNRLYLYDNAAGITEKTALLEEYEKTPLPGYSYEQNRSFNKQLQNNLSTEINRARTSALDDLTSAINAMKLTGEAPSGFEINEDQIRQIFSEEQADEYISSWNEASEDVLNRGALAYMSPERTEEITTELKAEYDAAQQSGISEDITKAGTRYNEWVKDVAKRNDALNKDAALFVVQNNESAFGMMNAITDDISSGNIDGASQKILQFRDIIKEQFDTLGVAPYNPIMPKAFASQMVEIIQSIDTDVAPEVFARITNLGDYSGQFIEELRKANLSSEYVQALYVDAAKPGVRTELLELSGQDIKDIKVGVDPADVNNVTTELITSLDDYRTAYLAGGNTVAEKIFNEQYAVIEKMALSRMKRKNISAADAVSSAINDILPESTQVVLSTQGQYVVPMQFNAQSIETDASRLLNEKILEQIGVDPLDIAKYPGDIDEAISLASLASTGVWFNNSTGDGLVLHYSVNDYFIPALKKDGSEFEVKFADMSTILNTAVENLEREETALDADILTPGQYQEAILGITPGQKGLLEIETSEEEAPVIEEPIEKSKLELQKEKVKEMIDTAPLEIQKATSLENRKLLNRYKEEASKGIVNDPDFFLSFDDWLKGQ